VGKASVFEDLHQGVEAALVEEVVLDDPVHVPRLA
jgi:hypothetical protein